MRRNFLILFPQHYSIKDMTYNEKQAKKLYVNHAYRKAKNLQKGH